MDINRITHPLRLAKGSQRPGSAKGTAVNANIGKVLVGAVGAVISVGLAAPASADPVTTVGADPVTTVGANPVPPPPSPQNFVAAVRGAGITGADPAILEDGYQVCRRIWVRQMPGTQVAAGLVQDHPQLTIEQAGQFVLAAYHELCPTPAGFDGGTWDYWAYSTS